MHERERIAQFWIGEFREKKNKEEEEAERRSTPPAFRNVPFNPRTAGQLESDVIPDSINHYDPHEYLARIMKEWQVSKNLAHVTCLVRQMQAMYDDGDEFEISDKEDQFFSELESKYPKIEETVLRQAFQ
jgi:hypothetical protein